ncbi:tyrosine recombinase XerC [Oxalobacteraceae bacterium CAVE-383]|nr:tyrosine recombinase XerC [Oxalobacteraceae bacterium CAVE-383]
MKQPASASPPDVAGSGGEVIERYLASLAEQRQLSPHTVSNYGRDLQELAEMVQTLPQLPAPAPDHPEPQANAGLALSAAPYAAVSHAHIRKFAAQLHAKGLNPRSIARKLSAWRGFYDWLSDQLDRNTLKSNPVDGVKAPKRARPLPKALAADDAIAVVSQSNPVKDAASAMQLCNRAMFELLYSSGLRAAELSGLDLRYVASPGYSSSGWIDFDAGEVTVTGKGNKMRTVPVGAPALQAVRQWLAVRDTLLKGSAGDHAQDAAALFLSERGTRISPRVLQQRLKAHGQALGVPSNMHPHVLRHSFASHMLQGSGDLRAVQEMLGHASITATQVYTSLDFQRLAQVYDAAHPRAKKVDPK